MLDVNTAYNMENSHLIAALRCENLGPRATMLLETIEDLVDNRSDREDELEQELDETKKELKSLEPLKDAIIEDEDNTVALLECLEAHEIEDPKLLERFLGLLDEHDIETPEDLEKLLVAVKVLQELKDDD